MGLEVALYHGGRFKCLLLLEYIGGRVKHCRIDEDKMFFFELKGLHMNVVTRKISCCFLNCLEPLSMGKMVMFTDKDVRNAMNHYRKDNVSPTCFYASHANNKNLDDEVECDNL